jgi:hypothetical protein
VEIAVGGVLFGSGLCKLKSARSTQQHWDTLTAVGVYSSLLVDVKGVWGWIWGLSLVQAG